MRSIALQLYTVRQALALNPEKTLSHVRSFGYQAVETAPLPQGLSAPELKRFLDNQGLQVTAAHTDLPLGDRRDEVFDLAGQLGTTRLIWHGWPRDPASDSLGGFRRLADQYIEAFNNARIRGLQLGLHNHWWEYERIDGVYPYQLLHQLLPLDLFFELDVYWAQTAGMNPTQMVRELGPRIQMLHLKDGPAVHGQPMTALGKGAVDLLSVLQATSTPLDVVVELDECATDPMEAARESWHYLQSSLPTPSKVHL